MKTKSASRGGSAADVSGALSASRDVRELLRRLLGDVAIEEVQVCPMELVRRSVGLFIGHLYEDEIFRIVLTDLHESAKISNDYPF